MLMFTDQTFINFALADQEQSNAIAKVLLYIDTQNLSHS